MSRSTILLSSTFLWLALAGDKLVFGDEQLVSITLKPQRSQILGGRPKLSSSLTACKESRGTLRGSTANGRLVYAVDRPSLTSFTASAAVRSVKEVAEIPADWSPVSRVKISYQGLKVPTEGELRLLGLRLVEDYGRGEFVVAEPNNRRVDAALAIRLEASPVVRHATAVFRILALSPRTLVPPLALVATTVSPPTNDPRWADLWGMRNIHAPIPWGGGIHDSRDAVIVAVIDTGIDHKHEDLAGNLWADAAGNHGFDFVENDADPMDLNGHGTHCAGTVGAKGNNGVGVVGVNWKVKIMGVRWLDANGSGQVVDAIKAIDFAVANGARVLSNSWFWTEDDPDLEAAIERARAGNAIFVAAAANFAQDSGNNGGDNDQSSTFGRYPSAYPGENIVSVAAIDESDRLAPFSQFGATTVDLAAPGVLILSTVPNNGYDGTFSGTSMATPHVAGTIALTLSTLPEPTNPLEAKQAALQARQLVLDHARKIPAMAGKCVTGGTLDLEFLKKP